MLTLILGATLLLVFIACILNAMKPPSYNRDPSGCPICGVTVDIDYTYCDNCKDDSFMSNCELLEYAAKAAGVKGEVVLSEECCYFRTAEHLPNGTRYWNPLADDSDALRLAVKCLEFYTLKYSREDWEHCNQDGYAATRRAIVRAAAEIGKLIDV